MDPDVPVVIRGLAKDYARTTALDGVDLEVHRGEVVGYLGPNGAGKTTTLRILMGFLRPTAGSAAVLGLDAWRSSAVTHRRIGYVPGEMPLHDRLTGRQHVESTARLRRDPDSSRATGLARRLDLDLDRPTRALSKGNRQKLGLVLALMSRPDLLVLDEPTAGFDPLVQQEFHSLLREHTATGGGVLLSSHVLGEVERVADRIAVLRAGRLVAVERIDVLRARSLHRVRARLDSGPPAAALAGVPGVRDVVVDGASVALSAPASALDAVLRQLTAHRVLDLECTEAGLEETFLAYYGDAGGPAAAPRGDPAHAA